MAGAPADFLLPVDSLSQVDDLALIDEDDITRLGLKVIDNKRLRTVILKAQHMDEFGEVPNSPGSVKSRPPSAGLQKKYMGARTVSLVHSLSDHMYVVREQQGSTPCLGTSQERGTVGVSRACV